MPGQVSAEEESAIRSTYPGSGAKTIPMTPENWQLITDDMANVVGPIGTAAAAHLEGVDFAGKTGTAQVMSHAALARTNKGHETEPNAWFVGMAPRRNPDIVVAVLWEHGNWGNNSAKLAAQVVDAFVNKQRAKAGNLQKVAESPMVPVVETPKAAEAPASGDPAGAGR
jgi:penicillin-binding protein 2